MLKKECWFCLLFAGSQFPNQGWNLQPLQWKSKVLTVGPLGKSQECWFALRINSKLPPNA